MNKILIIDNYDSFVYNIVQYLGEIDSNSKIFVARNDKISISKVEEISPTHIIISPGPGRPENTGIVPEIIKKFYKKIPILGVCLGHQAIGMVFGANIIHSKKIIHGKTSIIHHTEIGIFEDVSNPFEATRYHSLVIEEKSLPDSFIITAKSEDTEEIMAIQHKEFKLFGVQFHPESILTIEGKKILKNFIDVKEKKIESITFTKKTKFDATSALNKILSNSSLNYEEAKNLMEQIMNGKLSNSQIAAFLISLRMKGETGEEIAAMAKVMQEKAIRIKKFNEKTVDSCGTGGDGAGTFNISTATAFVVSAGGIPVAKHGNRSVSSKVGSADILEASGYNLNKNSHQLEDELKNLNFTFLFAPLLHPAMKNVMPVRKELKVRTIFNILGPLTNPANVKYQIIGVFNKDYAIKIAQALQILQTEKSAVIFSDWTDELTTASKNFVFLVSKKSIENFEIDLKELSLSEGKKEELLGEEDPKKAAERLFNLLKGNENKTLIETVALNSGMLFYITGECKNLKSGVEKALNIIYSGKAFEKLMDVLNYQKKY